jgi:hypothetical protein
MPAPGVSDKCAPRSPFAEADKDSYSIHTVEDDTTVPRRTGRRLNRTASRSLPSSNSRHVVFVIAPCPLT